LLPEPALPPWRRRFRWSLAIGILAIVLVEAHLLSRATWDATLTVPVHITAVDVFTGSPVPGVSIIAFDRNRAPVRLNSATVTDDAGNATVRIYATASGQRSAIYESSTASAGGARIECSATGYISQEFALVESPSFGRFIFIRWGSPEFNIRVPMRRASTR
jgi:hypothetical protein